MLCTQISVLGTGAAYILRYPRSERPSELLDVAVALVTVAALLVGGVGLICMRFLRDEFAALASHVTFTAAFAGVAVLGTVTVLFDQVAMAIGRGDHVLIRNAASGVPAIVVLALLSLAGVDLVGQQLFQVWILGAVTAFIFGLMQLRRTLAYRYRPKWDGSTARLLLRLGMPNHLLTLAQRTPGLIVPVMVANLLSLTDNAHWYVVWMMAWAVYIAPISVGLSLFAEAARHPESAASATRKAIMWSLAIGSVGAGALAVLAGPLLSLLGPGYSSAGEVPLRILLVAVIPITVVEAYFATCRSRSILLEPIVTAAITASVACTMMLFVGTHDGPAGGLVGMALVWVAIQCAAGLWAWWRLRRMTGTTAISSSMVPPLPQA